MSSYIKSKKGKKDWQSMGFGKGKEKEEEVEKDSSWLPDFSKIKAKFKPDLREEAGEFFNAAREGRKKKKKGEY